MPTFTAAKHIREFLSRQTVEQLEEAGECPAPPVLTGFFELFDCLSAQKLPYVLGCGEGGHVGAQSVSQSARMRNADRLFTSQPLPC
jgi:hypothetical protein